MLIIDFRPLGLVRKKEIWFYDGSRIREVGYNTYSYASHPSSSAHFALPTEQTSRIDLLQTVEKIRSDFHTTTRYHIRKGEKMGLEVSIDTFPSETVCREIARSFTGFAKQKKIAPINLRRLLALRATQNLILSSVQKKQQTLIRHLYLHDNKRILLMHTFHDPVLTNERERSYANKYLHYCDLVRFREMGFTEYDWGGINPESVPGVTRFKMSFGGHTAQVYNYARVSILLRPLIRIYKLLKRK